MNPLSTDSTNRPLQKQEKLLCILFAVGFLCFVITLFFRNHLAEQHQHYLENQEQVATCDINYVMDYQSLYMGDASNTTGLFRHLPLGNQMKDFQLFPDTLTVQVNFLEPYLSSGRGYDLSSVLIYNATTAFALIDNLDQVTYIFSDGTYLIKRSDVETVFGSLSTLLQEDTWNTTVRNPLCDSTFLKQNQSLLTLQNN